MKTKTKKRFIIISVLVLPIIVVVSFIGYKYIYSLQKVQTFTGEVTAIKGCDEYIGIGSDRCTWVISDKEVKYSWGSSLASFNNAPKITGLNSNGDEADIGKTVEVRAHRIGHGRYELQGSSDYLIVK